MQNVIDPEDFFADHPEDFQWTPELEEDEDLVEDEDPTAGFIYPTDR